MYKDKLPNGNNVKRVKPNIIQNAFEQTIHDSYMIFVDLGLSKLTVNGQQGRYINSQVTRNCCIEQGITVEPATIGVTPDEFGEKLLEYCTKKGFPQIMIWAEDTVNIKVC